MKIVLDGGGVVELIESGGVLTVDLDLPEHLQWKLKVKDHHVVDAHSRTLSGGDKSQAPEDVVGIPWVSSSPEGGGVSIPGGYGVHAARIEARRALIEGSGHD